MASRTLGPIKPGSARHGGVIQTSVPLLFRNTSLGVRKMGSNWEAIGFFRWPMSLCFLAVIVLGLWSALKLFRVEASPKLRTKVWLDGVLVWGFLAFLSGILGGVVGIILSIQSIEAAGAFVGTAAAPGAKMTLLSLLFGTTILGFALLLWYVLQLRWRLLQAASAEAEP